jgi:hypothetical protein
MTWIAVENNLTLCMSHAPLAFVGLLPFVDWKGRVQIRVLHIAHGEFVKYHMLYYTAIDAEILESD